MSAQACDWVGIYGALHSWCWQATGIPADRVRAQINRDLGEAKGPGPKATIDLLSLVKTSQVSRKPVPMVMRQRYTVILGGAGEVGVDFYAGTSLTPTRISITAVIADTPTTSAAKLLAELITELPAGYTASADPDDATAVLVDGATATPLFAARTADATFVTVSTPIPRFPYLKRTEHRAIWRITFRTADVAAAATQSSVANGPRFAADLMTRAQTHRDVLDRYMLRFGFRGSGTPNSQPDVPSDRSESTAVLDVAFIGLLTGAEAATAMRATKFSTTAA